MVITIIYSISNGSPIFQWSSVRQLFVQFALVFRNNGLRLLYDREAAHRGRSVGKINITEHIV
jgi:hypothetical protein